MKAIMKVLELDIHERGLSTQIRSRSDSAPERKHTLVAVVRGKVSANNKKLLIIALVMVGSFDQSIVEILSSVREGSEKKKWMDPRDF